jgi:hypothetical protein
MTRDDGQCFHVLAVHSVLAASVSLLFVAAE